MRFEVRYVFDEFSDFQDAYVFYPDGSQEVLAFVQSEDEADDEGNLLLQPFSREGLEQWAREVAGANGWAGCDIVVTPHRCQCDECR